MTSRVQKGSTVFRPVVKSRNRTAPSASRQASVAVEQRRGESTNVTVPDTSFAPPSLPSSSSLLPTEDPQGPTLDQQATQASSNTVAEKGLPTHGSSSIPDSQPGPPRNPIVPPIVGSTQRDSTRSRSAVPMVISTPRNSTPSWSGIPIVFPRNNLPPPTSQTQAQESTQNLAAITPPSTDATIVVEENGASTSLPTLDSTSTTLTHHNLADPAPSEQEPAAKTTRKRKTPNGTTKNSKKRKDETGDTEDVENQQEGPSTKRPRSRASSRASSSTPRPRRRAPSPPPYDPDADPGEDLDPTTVTMASLCSDTGQGRVSRKAAEILSNHAAWKASNREKRARMKQLMEAKKYGRVEELEAGNNADGEAQDRTQTPAANEGGPSDTPTIVDDSGNGFDYSLDLSTSRYNVQVRIGPNGETVIDEESLVVDRAENDGTENYTHVIESDQTKFVNSGTYGKRFRGSRWSAEETELFYDALAQYGENYELIAYVLPGRDRKSCKNKFKIEDKRNPARINHCLNNSIPVDMKTLSRMTGKDFSGPVPEICLPPPPPLPPSVSEGDTSANLPAENTSPRTSKKSRSRSRSRGVAESGVIVLGAAETFDS